MKLIFLMLISLAIISSCEDVIDIELDNGENQLSVDAWLDNSSNQQVIKLRMTGAYFDNTPLPAILGAEVYVVDYHGDTLRFIDTENNGNYILNRRANISMEFRDTFHLFVDYQGEVYHAFAPVGRVPVIDSIVYKFEPAGFGREKDGYEAQFYARDLIGSGDCYWIRGFRNGERNLNPFSIVLAYDGATGRGSSADGIIFAGNIRNSINPPFNEDPLQLGETVGVELLAISEEGFQHLTELRTQISNGGLFAQPPANVRTNVFNLNPTGKKAVGYFNVGPISSKEITIESLE